MGTPDGPGTAAPKEAFDPVPMYFKMASII